jgi:predicted RNA-binding protein with PIN domain
MSLHYLIDGYNLIWSAENFGGGKLQNQRERLLKFLEQTKPAGSSRNQVTVVFDGQEDVDGPPWRGTVRVIFSKGENADSVIKRTVDSMSNPSNAIVITDDRDIQKWVKSSKAKVMGCKEFLKSATQQPRPRPGGRKMDPDTANTINEEFKKLWKI